MMSDLRMAKYIFRYVTLRRWREQLPAVTMIICLRQNFWVIKRICKRRKTDICFCFQKTANFYRKIKALHWGAILRRSAQMPMSLRQITQKPIRKFMPIAINLMKCSKKVFRMRNLKNFRIALSQTQIGILIILIQTSLTNPRWVKRKKSLRLWSLSGASIFLRHIGHTEKPGWRSTVIMRLKSVSIYPLMRLIGRRRHVIMITA